MHPWPFFFRQRRRANEAAEVELVGEVAGKICIIIDDIADTAETLVQASKSLKARGAKFIICAVIHGVFSDPAIERINKSDMDMIIVTDTIPLDDKIARCPKLRVVSVAPMLAAAIVNVNRGKGPNSSKM